LIFNCCLRGGSYFEKLLSMKKEKPAQAGFFYGDGQINCSCLVLCHSGAVKIHVVQCPMD
jgi:hypothetical protein